MISHKIETSLGTLNLGFGLQNLTPVEQKGNEKLVFASENKNQFFCQLNVRENEQTPSKRTFEVQVDGLAGPGTAPVLFETSCDDPQGLKYWMPWDGPQNPATRSESELEETFYGFVPDCTMLELPEWKNPLRPVKFADRQLVYGGHPSLGAGFVLPMITFFRENCSHAVTLLFSEDSPLIEFRARIQEAGSVEFSDRYHRIEKGRSFKYRLHILEHESGWRAALGAAAEHYKEALTPSAVLSQFPEGFAGYSRQHDDGDQATIKTFAPAVLNWASSFEFPFMGMFQPDVDSDEEKWTAISCLGDGRVKAGQEESNSVTQLRKAAQRVTRHSGHVLGYFNINEFGFGIRYPAPAAGESFAYDPARRANKVLWEQFPNALLFGSHHPVNGPIFRTCEQHHELQISFHDRPYWTWGDSVATDPGDPDYQKHLVEQLRRTLERIPEYSGICIDRCDWTQEYNHHADDGESWIADRPVRSLVSSWKTALRAMRKVADSFDRVIYASASNHRADITESLDGIFHEGGYYGQNMNMGSFLTLFKPLMVWSHPTELFQKNEQTWMRIQIFSGEEVEESAKAFFERHLLMGAWPMLPLAGNDHSIHPTPGLLELYKKHAPLFRCLEGKKWVLRHQAVKCTNLEVEANIFETNHGIVIPLAFTDGSEFEIAVNIDQLKPESARMLVAGEESVDLSIQDEQGTLRFKVKPPADKSSLILLSRP